MKRRMAASPFRLPTLQPRIEGEVAFLIRDRLIGPDITPEQFLACVRDYGLGVEIVDSRIANWRIKLADTIADNASYGGFNVGPWDAALGGVDLSQLVMKIRHNGELAAEGPASAVMGHPAVGGLACQQARRIRRQPGARRCDHLRRHRQDAAGQGGRRVRLLPDRST